MTFFAHRALVLLTLTTPAIASSACKADSTEDTVSLLQTGKTIHEHSAGAPTPAPMERPAFFPKEKLPYFKMPDLVMMHVPFNFGFTIAMERLATPRELDTAFGKALEIPNVPHGIHGVNWIEAAGKTVLSEEARKSAMKMNPGTDLWGAFNKDTLSVNKDTGCAAWFAPQKYWPAEIAESYFGTKTVFGVLRDPYERLISMFRGEYPDYGGAWPDFYKTCDVNGALKAMIREAKANPYAHNCTLLPQAEYFGGQYGITEPVDGRFFPMSMNQMFTKYGYTDKIDSQTHILHVQGCDNVWAGDLDAETKLLVKDFYKDDFALLCKHFNHCDDEENVCLIGVENMCPEKLFSWDNQTQRYFKV